ncbi:MAG TPA: hypothetical protein VFK32_01300 [Tepidiformaceae bacterium]|nr:hypothetical protein [Tepidiformaceae bacterium]
MLECGLARTLEQIWRRAVVAVPILVVALTLGGCSGSGQPEETPSWLVELQPNIARSWEAVSEEQRDALADGGLTFAEYERAVLAEVECLTAEGLTIRTPPVYDPIERRFRFNYTSASGSDARAQQDAVLAVADACTLQHSGMVGAVWGLLNQPTPEEIAEAREAIMECLRASDVAEHPPVGTAEFTAWVTGPDVASPARDCLVATYSQFGVVP